MKGGGFVNKLDASWLDIGCCSSGTHRSHCGNLILEDWWWVVANVAIFWCMFALGFWLEGVLPKTLWFGSLLNARLQGCYIGVIVRIAVKYRYYCFNLVSCICNSNLLLLSVDSMHMGLANALGSQTCPQPQTSQIVEWTLVWHIGMMCIGGHVCLLLENCALIVNEISMAAIVKKQMNKNQFHTFLPKVLLILFHHILPTLKNIIRLCDHTHSDRHHLPKKG